MKALAWLACTAWAYAVWRIYQHSHGGAVALATAGILLVLIEGNAHFARVRKQG